MTESGEGGGGTVVRARVALTDISSRAWEHPADRGALTALRQLKGFDFILKKMGALWNERALRLIYLGSAVKVDHHQFPQIHRAFLEAAATLDVRDLPDVFVLANPLPNAMTLGIDRPFIVVNSGLVDLVDDEELRFVLGHELGHAESGHALYTTMLVQLLRLAATLSWLPLGALGLRAILAALFEWQRKAELSGDRAGLLAGQDPAAALRVHMKLAGGGHLDDLDPTSFLAQGNEYLSSPDVRDSVLKLLLLEARSHPFAVVRAAELHRWVDDGSYTSVITGNYPRRGDDDQATASDAITDAAKHYKDAFERSQDPIATLLRDVGGTLANARDWVTSRFSRTPNDEDH